jgi:hypothetical protein
MTSMRAPAWWRRLWVVRERWARVVLAVAAMTIVYFVPALSWPGGATEAAVECEIGLTTCPTGCVDTLADAANCGACGRLCPQGADCRGGACVPECAAGAVDHCRGD